MCLFEIGIVYSAFIIYSQINYIDDPQSNAGPTMYDDPAVPPSKIYEVTGPVGPVGPVVPVVPVGPGGPAGPGGPIFL